MKPEFVLVALGGPENRHAQFFDDERRQEEKGDELWEGEGAHRRGEEMAAGNLSEKQKWFVKRRSAKFGRISRKLPTRKASDWRKPPGVTAKVFAGQGSIAPAD